MKFLILNLFAISFAFAGIESELGGFWRKVGENGPAINFVKINNQYYFHSQEKFVFSDGTLSHTIDQSMKITSVNETGFQGSVDFFDSRGCSFKNLPVVGEFQNEDVANVMVTVPRYQYVTITSSRRDPYERPRYCPVPYPGRGYYICGTQEVVISRRSECRLLENIEIPVQLERVH